MLHPPLLLKAFHALVHNLSEERLRGRASFSPISLAIAIVDGVGRAILHLACSDTSLEPLHDSWPFLLARMQWLYSSVVATAQFPMALEEVVVYDAVVHVLGRTLFGYTQRPDLASKSVARAEVVGLLTRLHLATRPQSFLRHCGLGLPFSVMALMQLTNSLNRVSGADGRAFGPHVFLTSVRNSSGGCAASQLTRLLRFATRKGDEMHPHCLSHFFDIVLLLLRAQGGGSAHALWSEALQNHGIASLTRAAALHPNALARYIPGYFSMLHSIPLAMCYSTVVEAVHSGLFRVYANAARSANSRTLLSAHAGLMLTRGCLAIGLVYHIALDKMRTAFDAQVSLDSSARLGASAIGAEWAAFERLLLEREVVRYQFRQDSTPRLVCDIVRANALVLGQGV